MTTKLGAPASIVPAPALWTVSAPGFTQAVDKYNPAGTRPTFTSCTVLNAAAVAGINGAPVTLIPDPGVGNTIIVKDYRLIVSDTPNTAALNITAQGGINGVSGFSTTGLTPGGVAQAGTAFTNGGAVTLQYHAGTVAVSPAIPAGFVLTAVAAMPAVFTGPVVAAQAVKGAATNGVPSVAGAIEITNATGAFQAGANCFLTIIINYEIVSARA